MSLVAWESEAGVVDAVCDCHDGEYQSIIRVDLSLNLLLPVPTRPKKPTKPAQQVWVSNGYLKHDLYLYSANPYPHTHMGLQTHDMH